MNGTKEVEDVGRVEAHEYCNFYFCCGNRIGARHTPYCAQTPTPGGPDWRRAVRSAEDVAAEPPRR